MSGYIPLVFARTLLSTTFVDLAPFPISPPPPHTHRKNHQRQLEALQQSLEEETRGKMEQSRQKKAMEEQLNELQGSIDDAQKV